jgi:hypothetical protein
MSTRGQTGPSTGLSQTLARRERAIPDALPVRESRALRSEDLLGDQQRIDIHP